jgi:hypothetical protein
VDLGSCLITLFLIARNSVKFYMQVNRLGLLVLKNSDKSHCRLSTRRLIFIGIIQYEDNEKKIFQNRILYFNLNRGELSLIEYRSGGFV